jgi:AcrR family transcriptional regulator
MKSHRGLVPAPKRGQYDRSLDRRERHSVQRERILEAVAALLGSEQAPTVANAVKLAGIGRNTFYEYFDDIEHAVAQAGARAVREFVSRLEVAQQGTLTGVDRVRALTRAWSEYLLELPRLAQIALRPQPETTHPTQLSALAEQAMRALSDVRQEHGSLPGIAHPTRVLAVAALFDVVSRQHLAAPSKPTGDLQCILFDLAQRLLS